MSAPAIAVPGSLSRRTETTPSTPEIQAPPSPQDIANLAYALWQQRGGSEGSPEQDWLEAERKLQTQTATGRTQR